MSEFWTYPIYLLYVFEIKFKICSFHRNCTQLIYILQLCIKVNVKFKVNVKLWIAKIFVPPIQRGSVKIPKPIFYEPAQYTEHCTLYDHHRH